MLESPPSLPPAATETALATIPSTPAPPEESVEEKPHFLAVIPEDSKIRTTALKIMAMRTAGVADAEIARALGISPKTISPYVYKAGKMGWLDFDDPKESIEYKMLHKVVKRLDEGLEDTTRNEKTGMQVRTTVALKIAEGTVFKRFTEPVGGTQVLTNISLKIESGPPAATEEPVDGGTPAYVDAEVVKPPE